MLVTLGNIVSHSALTILKILNTTSNPNINYCPVELQLWTIKAIKLTLQIPLALKLIPSSLANKSVLLLLSPSPREGWFSHRFLQIPI